MSDETESRKRGPAPGTSLDDLVRRRQHVAGLVEELLDQVQLQRRRIDLRDVVNDALLVAARDLRRRRQSIEVALPPEPVAVEGDGMRLFQSVFHLLDNAIRFTPEGGRIRVRAWNRPNECRIEIEDDGRGIEPPRLDELFVGLHGLPLAEAPAQSGLGLGLLLARRFVELHGGSLEIASEGTGQGCRATLRLPTAAANDAAG